MKILMIGSGGREHALIRKLMESPRVEQITARPATAVFRAMRSASQFPQWISKASLPSAKSIK